MEPFTVLGRYEPQGTWRAWKVGRALTKITKEIGLVPHKDPAHGPIPTASWVNRDLHAEVRRFTSNKQDAEDWHQDGDTTSDANMDCCLVLWASNTPTEIKIDGIVYTPRPYELVIFNNRKVSHRRPDGCPKDRWIFRQRVRVPEWMK